MRKDLGLSLVKSSDESLVDPTPNTFTTISASGEPDYFHFGIMGMMDRSPVTQKYLGLHRLGSNHLGNDGKMVKTTSDDRISWVLDPVPVVDITSPDYDVRAYGGGYLASGRYVCFYSTYQTSVAWKALWMIYTDDDGETWSEPLLLQTYTSSDRMHAHGNLVRLSNGDYIIMAYGLKNGSYEFGFFRSTNGGVDWAYETVASSGATYSYAEPTAEELSPGEILILVRKTATGQNTTYRQYHSINYGASFTDQGDTPFDSWVTASGRERPCFIIRKDYFGLKLMECWWVNTNDQKLKVIYAKAGDFAVLGIAAWNLNTIRVVKQLEPYTSSGGTYTRDGYQTILYNDNEWMGFGQIYVEHEISPGKSDIEYFWTPASNRETVLSALGLSLNGEFMDLKISEGDLVAEESDALHIQHILEALPGYYKEHPTLGAGISTMIKGSGIREWKRKAKIQLESDGYDINEVQIEIES
jgi:hypothetical protein